MEPPAVGGLGKNQILFGAEMNAQPAGLAFIFINNDIAPGGFGFSHINHFQLRLSAMSLES